MCKVQKSRLRNFYWFTVVSPQSIKILLGVDDLLQ